MAQIDGAGQQDTDNQNAEALQAALAQRQVTLQGQPQGGSDVPIHQNSDPVSDESEILRSCQPLTEKRRVPCVASGNCPELLELGKEVLDEVARLVEVFVESARRLAGCARWDHRRLAGFRERLEHALVRIERFVGNERLGFKLW